MPLIFLIDDSSYMSGSCDGVLSHLDTAKTLVESLVKHHGAAFNNQIMLLTYNTDFCNSTRNENVNVRVGWSDGPRQLEYHLKSLRLSTPSRQIDINANKRAESLSKAVLVAFSLLNRYRISENLDNIGCGNRPWISTASACIVLTTAIESEISTKLKSNDDRISFPSIDFAYSVQNIKPPDAAFFSSYYRWDQRLYSVILGSNTNAENINDPFIAWLERECSQTGGWIVQPFATSLLSGVHHKSSKSLKWSRLSNELDVICQDILERKVNISLTSPLLDDDSTYLFCLLPKVLSNRMESRNDGQSQADCGFWPIPENFSFAKEPFRPRPSLPCISLSKLSSDDKRILDELCNHSNLPFDTYNMFMPGREVKDQKFFLLDLSLNENEWLLAKMNITVDNDRNDQVKVESKSIGFVQFSSFSLNQSDFLGQSIGEFMILPLNFQRLFLIISRLYALNGKMLLERKDDVISNHSLSKLRGELFDVLRDYPSYYYAYLQSCFQKSLPWIDKFLDVHSFPQDNRKQLSIRLYEIRQSVKESLDDCMFARMCSSRQSVLAVEDEDETKSDTKNLSYSCSFAPFTFLPALEPLPAAACDISLDQTLPQWERMRAMLHNSYGKTVRCINLQRSGHVRAQFSEGKKEYLTCLESSYESLSRISKPIMDMSNYVEIVVTNELSRNPHLYDKLPTSTEWSKLNEQMKMEQGSSRQSPSKQTADMSPSSPSIIREEDSEATIDSKFAESNRRDGLNTKNVQLEYDVSKETDIAEIMRYKTSVDLANPFRRRQSPFFQRCSPETYAINYVHLFNHIRPIEMVPIQLKKNKIVLGMAYKKSKLVAAVNSANSLKPVTNSNTDSEKELPVKHKLPSEWIERYSNAKKHAYYFNTRTGETQWNPPK